MFYGLGAIGLAAAIIIVSSAPKETRARSAPLSNTPLYCDANGRTLTNGQTAIIVMVHSEEQAVRVRSYDIGGYYGDAATSFVVAETAQEAGIVRALLKDDPRRILIDVLLW